MWANALSRMQPDKSTVRCSVRPAAACCMRLDAVAMSRSCIPVAQIRLPAVPFVFGWKHVSVEPFITMGIGGGGCFLGRLAANFLYKEMHVETRLRSHCSFCRWQPARNRQGACPSQVGEKTHDPSTHPTLPETRVELERVAHCGQPRPTNRERKSGRCLRCLVDRSLLTRGEAGSADVSLGMIFCCLQTHEPLG